MNYVFIIFMACITLFRLFYAGHINLASDEAYYWAWSTHLSLGYYDSGSILAWVIRFFTSIVGHSELGVRMGSIVFSLGLSIFLYLLSSKFLSKAFAFLAVVIFNVTPGGVLIGILMMHDTLMGFFWIATVYSLYRAIFDDKKSFWYIAGIFAGFGLWGKDTMLLVLPITFMFLLFTKYRAWLLKKEPYIFAIIMIAVFSPIIYWNFTHDFLTYRHIFALGSRTPVNPVKSLGDFLGSQAGLISPFVWLGIFISWFILLYKWLKTKNEKLFFICAYSMSIFLFFLLLSLRSKVEGNWAGFGYYTGIICFLYVMRDLYMRGRKKFSSAVMIFSAGFSFVLITIVLFPKILYITADHLPVYKTEAQELLKDDRTNYMHGSDELGAKVKLFKENFYNDKDVFVFSLRYQISSLVAFYYPEEWIYCFPVSRRMNQYDVWDGLDKLVGKDGLLIYDKDSDPGPRNELYRYFDEITWQTDITVHRNDIKKDMPIREYSIYFCKNFKGIPKDVFPDSY